MGTLRFAHPTGWTIVARMKSGAAMPLAPLLPDFAALHPGYYLLSVSGSPDVAWPSKRPGAGIAKRPSTSPVWLRISSAS